MRIFLYILSYLLIMFFVMVIFRFIDDDETDVPWIALVSVLWPIGIPVVIIYICGYWIVEAAGAVAEKLQSLKDDAQIAIRKAKYHRTGRPPD